MTLPTYQFPIGGEWQSADQGAHFETHNPYTGAPWALIPRCTEADVGRAVAAAKAALDGGAWPAMTATQWGALLRRLGDLIAAHAEPLAQTEVRDNGKLIAEMLGQTRYVPQWYYYYGGRADKIEGGVLPIDKTGVFNFTRWEPLGVCRGDRAVEFTAAAVELETGTGAGGRQHRRHQTERIHISIHVGIRATDRAGRLSAWRRQHRHWFRQRGR